VFSYPHNGKRSRCTTPRKTSSRHTVLLIQGYLGESRLPLCDALVSANVNMLWDHKYILSGNFIRSVIPEAYNRFESFLWAHLYGHEKYRKSVSPPMRVLLLTICSGLLAAGLQNVYLRYP